jgi:hypothetical protein
MECQYCKNTFSNKTNLNTHQRRAKYCLKKQGSFQLTNACIYICEGCNKQFIKKYDYNRHLLICKKSSNVESYKKKYEVSEKKIIQLESENKMLLIQIENQKSMYQTLQDKLENIAIKAVERPTTTNMNKTNVNNFIQNMQPISSDHLLHCSSNLTLEHIQKGAYGYAEYALEYPLKNRIACVDYSRRKMKFKDNDGNLITDPEMVKLAPMFFDSIKDKSSQIAYDLNKKDMDSSMFEEVAKVFNTNSDVKNGATGIKTEFFHDFVKHICSGSVVE